QKEKGGHARTVEEAFGQPDQEKPAEGCQQRPGQQVASPHSYRKAPQRNQNRGGQRNHACPPLLEQDLHPEIEDVPRQMVVRRKEPTRTAAGKISISDQVTTAFVQQPHVVHVDDTSPPDVGNAESYGAPQEPCSRANLLGVELNLARFPVCRGCMLLKGGGF